ncbi:MAG: hypothetical protein H3C35_03830 [Bacteroidetes bacterium]|nr:hypothetical protein [Bacteroidota bacterium]
MKYLLLLASALLLSSCGMVNTIAVNATTNIVDYGLESIFEESDIALAGQAIPGNLTLLEALYRAKQKDDDHLALLLLEGYTGYTLGFVEDTDADRAKVLYTRARNYGLNVLKKQKQFSEALEGSNDAFKKSLEAFGNDDVPIIFWTANAWGNLINAGMADPEIVAGLPRVNAMMEFVLKHDEAYFYGGAHLYFGTILATIPKNLGGKPDSAKAHFEKCIKLGKGKLLLPYVYMARTYCTQVQDRELFQKLLQTVEDAPADILPEQNLVNAIAKKKAKQLQEKIDDLF